MPKLNFELPSPKSADEAYSKIQSFLQSENHFKKLDSGLRTDFDQNNKSCQIIGSQFKANLNVYAQDQSSLISIEVEIPFALALFKGKIKDEIEKAFKKVLT